VSHGDILLAIAVTLSMLVGWWRGRRSVGLEVVGPILDRASTSSHWLLRRDRTRFVIEYRDGGKLLRSVVTFDEKEITQVVNAWLALRGRS
jgi:hypothetical protein